MLFGNTPMIIILLFIMISLIINGQTQWVGCYCFSPTTGASCGIPGCSAGDNNSSISNNVLYLNVAGNGSFYVASACPGYTPIPYSNGFNYANGVNGYATNGNNANGFPINGGSYNFTNCTYFGSYGVTHFGISATLGTNGTFCCNYCCYSVSTTSATGTASATGITSVTGANSGATSTLQKNIGIILACLLSKVMTTVFNIWVAGRELLEEKLVLGGN